MNIIQSIIMGATGAAETLSGDERTTELDKLEKSITEGTKGDLEKAQPEQVMATKMNK